MRIQNAEIYRSAGALFVTVRLPVSEAENAEIAVNSALTALSAGKAVSMELRTERAKRSSDANAMLWACLTEIAVEIGADKWDVYLEMLKRYTKPIYVAIGKTKLEQFRKLYREIEVISDTTVNGQEALLVACYIGSSQLDTMGLATPADREMFEVIQAYEAQK